MFKKFLMNKMLKSQLKNVPQEEQEKILNAIENNPEFFEKIAKEIQEKIKSGKGQNEAVMEVMMKYQTEMIKLMNK